MQPFLQAGTPNVNHTAHFLYVLTIMACLNQPVHHCGSADTCLEWGSPTGPSQGKIINEQTSQPVKPFLSFVFFWLLPSLLSPLLFFGSNLFFWQSLTGNLAWRGVTGLAMQQSPVERAHIHSKWETALTAPKWACSQTAKTATAMLLILIITLHSFSLIHLHIQMLLPCLFA